MAKIDTFLKLLVEQGASDLHIHAGSPPIFRHQQELIRLKYHTLSDADAWALISEVLNDKQREILEKKNDLDLAYEVEGLARFRVNLFRQRHGASGVFRRIPAKIPSVEELELPPVVRKFAYLNQGLILVTGPASCGKTTTLAAIIDECNNNRRDHIITIEDPIEFIHTNKKCLINQRQVGLHTDTFAAALRFALREDPDIILVGELRDLETIQMAITAAETGHLVLGTLHTTDAAKTITRIIDAFPASQQAQIRTMLSESLKGVISQQLVKTVKGKLKAVMEILVSTTSLPKLIRDNKIYMIQSIMSTSKGLGMQIMDEELLRLHNEGIITGDEAFKKAHDKTKFEHLIDDDFLKAMAQPDAED